MLRVENLVKRYGDRVAVDRVSFEVEKGQTVGLLGPNGAGKTTTLSIITGLVVADSGSVHVGGASITSDPNAVKRQIGLVPQDLALYDEISARANLEVFGGLYGLSGATLARAIDGALSRVGLADRSRELVRGYSGGMKRRLNIAGALLHDPDIILLDEPTVGVDPQSRNAIFDNLEALKARGKTIVYTTHYMEEAERLCDRIVIIDHGRVLADDTLGGLQARVQSQSRLLIDIDPAAGPSALRALAEAGIDVRGSTTESASLESVFLTLTGRSLRDQ
jgi:ABC-2 type transport system ATP-binding protein